MKQKLMNLKIGAKLIIFVSAVIALLVLAIGAISLSVSKKALSDQVIAGMQNIADLKVDKIESFFVHTKSNAQLLQTNEVVAQALPVLSSVGENWEDSTYIAARATLQPALMSFKEAYKYHCIKLLDPQGRIVYNSEGAILDKKLGDPDNLASTEGRNGTFISGVYKEEGLFKLVITGPIMSGENLVGIAAMEIDMSGIYRFIQNTTGLGETGETLIGRRTEEGAIFLNPLRHDKGAALLKKAPFGSEAAKPILEAVSGNAGFGTSQDYRKKEVVAVWRYIPMLNWGLVAKIDSEEAFESLAGLQWGIVISSVIILLVGILGALWFARTLTAPIGHLHAAIQTLGQGKLLENEVVKSSNDEVGGMIDATNSLASFQANIIQFAKNVGSGKFENADEGIVNNGGDLGQALENMRVSLHEAAVEDDKRNWATEGLAKFADILRANSDDFIKLSDNSISELITYLNANQGSLFIVNEDDENNPFLDLTACYAWDQKKFREKKIELGEGLAGRAWQENATIYLTDVPESYISIGSGLGDANPTSILIVPLRIDKDVYGIIEIASFKELLPHEIEFVEKLAQSIASTISSVKMNERTKVLLEESQQQAEELKAQEEEMRQNMEELQATQEESKRIEQELRKQITLLKSNGAEVKQEST